MVKILPLHIGISVSDIDRSIDWYDRVLGFKLVHKQYIEGLKSKIAFIRNGDFEIELFQHDNAKPQPEYRKHPNTDNEYLGTKHPCFATDDYNGFMSILKENHADIIFSHENPNESIIYFRDPDGIPIEMIVGTRENVIDI